MRVFRVCPREEGERAFAGTEAAGRWNEEGTRLVYASATPALALLEQVIHVAEDGATDLVLAAADLPEDAPVEGVEEASLPEGWRDPEGHPELRRIGSAWVASGRSAVLAVPSAVVPEERNLLLDPSHPAVAGMRVHAPQPFPFDPRLRARPRRERPLPPLADGTERRLERSVVQLDRIVGLIVTGVLAFVTAGALGIAAMVADPELPTVLAGAVLWAAVVGGLAGVSLVWPPLAWKRASFRLDSDGLELRRGVWWRHVVRVPRSRVQHTDVTQGPIERSFGLSTLVVHTAGTSNASVQVEGLAAATAGEIRDFLISGDEDAV